MSTISATISATEAMRLQKAGKLPLLDVRAEGEFADGHIAGSFNAPILNDGERHQVGLTYKQQGQDAAVRLGHALVDPLRPARVSGWSSFLGHQETPLVMCWRGGLRSTLAQSWLKEAGLATLRIEGGYKALRGEILRELARPRRGLVITGNTGSGKTELLRRLHSPRAVDLEALAHHRGSSFGSSPENPQPAQQSFENALGQILAERSPAEPLLLEDESRLIGRCVIPEPFFDGMLKLPRVELETPFAERVKNIRQEYVDEPLARFAPEKVRTSLSDSIAALRTRLGGADTKDLLEKLSAALEGSGAHEDWISQLLQRYYDPRYDYARTRAGSPLAFRGDAAALAAYLRKEGY